MTLKQKAYFLNLLFLFYITLGPTKAFCYHVFSPNNTTLLFHLQTITKARLNKKIVSETNKYSKKDSKVNEQKKDVSLNLSSSSLITRIDLPIPITKVELFGMLRFSKIPLHLFYCILLC